MKPTGNFNVPEATGCLHSLISHDLTGYGSTATHVKMQKDLATVVTTIALITLTRNWPNVGQSIVALANL